VSLRLATFERRGNELYIALRLARYIGGEEDRLTVGKSESRRKGELIFF
jgi:hypothetical protein